jgi:ribosome biogenesis GTPase
VEKGLVIKSTGKWYQVQRADGSMIDCRIRGKFRMLGIRTTNPVAVGDWIGFELEGDDQGVIGVIEDRKNYIIRKSTNLSKQAHIIASNIDRAYLVATLASPATSTGFIDRFLVTAEMYHIPCTIIFNKLDLYGDKEMELLEALISIYEDIGYETMAISAEDEVDIAALQAEMKNQVNLLAGHSGVGKSTLINGLEADIDIKTQEVSDYHQKGKHTTTFAEMHPLTDGGYLIDTPGIKGFGVIDLEKEELSHYFPEMRELLEFCRFNNCVHVNEPHCAVKDAVENEFISEIRYHNYLAIYNDDQEESYR